MPLISTVREVFDHSVREHASSLFTSFKGRERSYREASDRANQLANALIAAGCNKGKRFVLLSKNSDEMAIAFMAAARSGAVLVPINYRLAPREWLYIINDAEAVVLIARNDDLVQSINSVRAELCCKQLLADNAEISQGWQNFADFVDSAPTTDSEVEIDAEDTYYQVYTSGTTGHPKGVEISNASITGYGQQAMLSLPYRSNADDKALLVVPMYHVAGASMALAALTSGGSLIIHEDANAHEIVRALDEDGVSCVTLIPILIQFCLMVEGIEQRQFKNLKYIAYGASAIAPEVLSQAMKVFGCDFVQGFGMTETTAATTILSAKDHQRALREKPELLQSAGRPLLGSAIRIVDENDKELPTGEIGEIVLKGPQVMKGYWKLPEKTAETIKDGWLHTGDAGRMDEEGFLYVEDRIKDMIISGGENIYSREVENALFEHPQIVDAAVIGLPDPKWGEVPVAVLVTADGEPVNAEELTAFCRERLAGYKIPRRAEYVKELPRNPSGKVLKTELRKQYG